MDALLLTDEGKDHYCDFIPEQGIRIEADMLKKLYIEPLKHSLVIGISVEAHMPPKGTITYLGDRKPIFGWYNEIFVNDFSDGQTIELMIGWSSEFIKKVKYCFWRKDKQEIPDEKLQICGFDDKKFREENAEFDVIGSGTPESVISAFKHMETMRVIPGDYFEFGVYQGHSLYTAMAAATKLGFSDMRFFGFDSFEGLPEPTGIDREFESKSVEHWEKGMYACTLDDVVGRLERSGVDMSKVRLIKGFFDRSLRPELIAQYGMAKAAVILIDSDLYESARCALEFVKPLIADGTIIIFDEWNAYAKNDEKGERKAFCEFLAANPEMEAIEIGSHDWHSVTFRIRLT